MKVHLDKAKKIKLPFKIEKKPYKRGVEWNRTTDTRIFSPLLYQLSYDTILPFWDCKDRIIFYFQKNFL